jgi:hypothetical protein
MKTHQEIISYLECAGILHEEDNFLSSTTVEFCQNTSADR